MTRILGQTLTASFNELSKFARKKYLQVQENFSTKLFIKMILSSQSNLTSIHILKVNNKNAR